ncbi:unnamed protein product [Closterium sp. NIES-65]|nr:unnamed protein product [Closterium sp. NIES-65]
MATTISDLTDDLLDKIIWYPQESVSSQLEVSFPGASVSPRPTYTSERPYGDESFLSTPPASADAAFSLLVTSVCRRWRRLAQNRVSTLLVKDHQVVSLRDLTAAVKCFPNLTHVHLSDNSVETIDDTFLAHLASSSPKLKALHVGKEITQTFPIAQLPCLKSLELEAGSPRFDLLFPPDQPCSSLEKLFLGKISELLSLPDGIGELLPRLRELTISDRENLANLPDGFNSLTSLQRLTISQGKLTSLPETFGELPALTSLSLDLPELTHLPDSFCLLTALKILNLTNCKALRRLPSRLSGLTALQSLSVFNSPILKLSEDIGDLTNLQTFHLNIVHAELPSNLTRLSSLTSLQIFQSTLSELPEGIGKLRNLRVLFLLPDSNALPDYKLPESVTDLVSLEILKVGCLTAMPRSLSSLVRLRELMLSKTPQLPEAVMTLPTSLETLSVGSYQLLVPLLEIPALPRLRELSLTSVGLLRGLNTDVVLPCLEHLELVLPRDAEDLPVPLAAVSNIRSLTIRDGGRLLKLPDEVGSTLLQLRQLRIEKAQEMAMLPAAVTQLQCLTSIEIHAPRFQFLPEEIGALLRLRVLNLADCLSFKQLPASLMQLSCLHHLNLRNTSICSLPPNFAAVSRLKKLDLYGCKQLESLPDDVTQLKMLYSLNLTGCDKLLDSRSFPMGVMGMYGLDVETWEEDGDGP